jgi:hypothetical protein
MAVSAGDVIIAIGVWMVIFVMFAALGAAAIVCALAQNSVNTVRARLSK